MRRTQATAIWPAMMAARSRAAGVRMPPPTGARLSSASDCTRSMRRACSAGTSPQTAIAASVAAVDASATRQSSVISLNRGKSAGRIAGSSADEQPRARHAENAAGDADDHALRQPLARQPHGARTERRAHGHFAAALRDAGELHRRDAGDRGDEEQQDGSEQYANRRTNLGNRRHRGRAWR